MAVNESIHKSSEKQEPSSENVFREYDFIAIGVEGGCAVIKYEGTDTVAIIPETICGKPVVAVGDEVHKPYPFNDYVFGDFGRDDAGKNNFMIVIRGQHTGKRNYPFEHY